MLKIENLHVKVEDTEILKGFHLEIKPGEVHAIMGPNGSGKSTLSKAIVGHEEYKITKGNIYYKGKDLHSMSVEERACEGIFAAFQYPVEIPGVNNTYFLRSAYNAISKYRGEPEIDTIDFLKIIRQELQKLDMKENLINRSLNEGFSGGEKKQNEILQLSILNPDLAILDETDSGLDIDALKTVANGINRFRSKDKAVLLVTHYQRMLDYVVPDYVHILLEGKIAKTGDRNLALELEKRGYDWAKKEQLTL